jgi:3-oxoacyl-[acyl-carrier-protein] synthase II
VERERVWVTGIGVISPLGLGREAFWQAALDGRSGAVCLDSPWATETGLSTWIGAPVRGFDPVQGGVPNKTANVTDRNSQFAIAAAGEALRDAGFELVEDDSGRQLRIEGVDSARVITAIGSGIGGLKSLTQSHGVWRDKRSKNSVKRYALPMLIPNGPAGQVAIRYGARGECKALSTACAAGTMSIGDAWRILRVGAADMAIAGGTDATVDDDDSYGLMGFDRLRTLSQRNDDPERASRPFDKDRDGFVLGEGTAVMILEREEHAKARGATRYAQIAGYSTNCDAHSMMALDESGRSIVALIEEGLRAARVAPGDVDHVSAHGTSTVLNDRTEAKALRTVFGSHCDDVHVTALKSMTGHGIGGSGPLEAAAVAMSFRHGKLTPTINYETPDPECDVNVVANTPVEHTPSVALKLSYGFGGHNACLVFTR